MNYRLVSRYLGLFSMALGALMLPSVVWAVYFREWRALESLLGASAFSAVVGVGLAVAGGRPTRSINQQDALALVGFGWLWLAVLGALPYVFDGLLGPIDAYFESMSGFTTTGSTVLANIEAAPKSILFWRSFTHWLGGMGIVVLFISVLPFLGAGGKMLFRSESSQPDPHGLRPRIKDTASALWKIYLGMTVAETVALMLAGLSFFDALCQTFGTLATGGFSTRQASIAAFDSLAVEIIIMFFMVAAGVNFALYFALLRKRWNVARKDTEWRVYFLVLGAAVLAVTLNLYIPHAANKPPVYDSLGSALRHASFQTISMMTCTGFVTADFDLWPDFSRLLLVVLMFIGGCAGSTSGGIKIIRFVVLLKMAYARVEHLFRPRTVRVIRVSGNVVEENIQRTIHAFFVLYLAVFVTASLIMSSLGLSFETAISSVAATLNGVGPGLDQVGAVRDYCLIPAAGKVVLSLCMVIGRLELFSVLVLFVPGFWRRS
jgi:trk system potassium uptake protein TrkH